MTGTQSDFDSKLMNVRGDDTDADAEQAWTFLFHHIRGSDSPGASQRLWLPSEACTWQVIGPRQ